MLCTGSGLGHEARRTAKLLMSSGRIMCCSKPSSSWLPRCGRESLQSTHGTFRKE